MIFDGGIELAVVPLHMQGATIHCECSFFNGLIQRRMSVAGTGDIF